MAKRKSRDERLALLESEYRVLAKELASIGYIWQGTITRQTLTCGNQRCACHTDKARRHGPYIYWSTKVAGKTVSRLLTEEEARLYEEWIRNRKRLDQLRRKMLAISKKSAALLLPKRSRKRQVARRVKRARRDA